MKGVGKLTKEEVSLKEGYTALLRGCLLVMLFLVLLALYSFDTLGELEQAYCAPYASQLNPHDGQKMFTEKRFVQGDVCCVRYNYYENITGGGLSVLGFGWEKSCVWTEIANTGWGR